MEKIQAIFHREGRQIKIVLYDLTSAVLTYPDAKSAQRMNIALNYTLKFDKDHEKPLLLTKEDVRNFVTEVKMDIIRKERMGV